MRPINEQGTRSSGARVPLDKPTRHVGACVGAGAGAGVDGVRDGVSAETIAREGAESHWRMNDYRQPYMTRNAPTTTMVRPITTG